MRRLTFLIAGLLWLPLASGCGPGEDTGFANSSRMASNLQPVTVGECPLGATVLGIDVATYQGTVNWVSVHGAGIQFGIARVSHGTVADAYFNQNWVGMKAAGMTRGGYEYFEPDQDPLAQANLVISKVGRLGPGDLPVMLDFAPSPRESVSG